MTKLRILRIVSLVILGVLLAFTVFRPMAAPGGEYSEKVLIPDGKQFTYIHHLYRDQITDGHATFIICEEGKAAPIEQVSYYLK